MKNTNSAAIIIDQWYFPGRPFTTCNNIIKFLDANIVSTAILASYDININEYATDNLWYNNQRGTIDNLPSDHGHQNITIPTLLNYKNNSIFQIALTRSWQLENYLKWNPQIKNLFVLGVAWEICVKHRDLGYLNLFKMFGSKDINILTYAGCVGHGKGRSVDLDQEVDWIKIAENIYKYVPTN